MSEAVNILLPLLSEEQREERHSLLLLRTKQVRFFSLFALECATWEGMEVRASQSGPCTKVGRKWQ